MQSYHLDIIFAFIVLALVITGWRRGFVRMTGGLVSLVVSVGCGVWGVGWLEDILGIPLSSTFVGLVFAFVAITVFVGGLLNLLVKLLDLVRRLFTLIPGIGLLHHAAGALVGAAEAFVLVLVTSYLAVYVLTQSDVRTLLLRSQTVHYGTQALDMLNRLFS